VTQCIGEFGGLSLAFSAGEPFPRSRSRVLCLLAVSYLFFLFLVGADGWVDILFRRHFFPVHRPLFPRFHTKRSFVEVV